MLKLLTNQKFRQFRHFDNLISTFRHWAMEFRQATLCRTIFDVQPLQFLFELNYPCLFLIYLYHSFCNTFFVILIIHVRDVFVLESGPLSKIRKKKIIEDLLINLLNK